MQAHLKDLIAGLLAPLYPQERGSLLRDPDAGALRGLLYQLEQGLGTVPRRDLAQDLATTREAPQRAAAAATPAAQHCRALVRVQQALGCDEVCAGAVLQALDSTLAV